MKKSSVACPLRAVSFLLVILLFSSCTFLSGREGLCRSPYFEFKSGECCLDSDHDSICDQDQGCENISLVQVSMHEDANISLFSSTKANITVEKIMGIIRNESDEPEYRFNSISFNVENKGKTDLNDQMLSVKVYYVYPSSGRRIQQYSYNVLMPKLKQGSSADYKVRIPDLVFYKGVVQNKDSTYVISVSVLDSDRTLDRKEERVIISPSRFLKNTSFSTEQDLVMETKFSSTVSIRGGEVFEGGKILASLLVAVENNNNLKSPVLDVYIDEDYSVVFRGVGDEQTVMVMVPLDYKTSPVKTDDRAKFKVHVELRDGTDPRVYAVDTFPMEVVCDKKPKEEVYSRCEVIRDRMYP